MLLTLVKDVLPHIRMDELFSSCIESLKLLLRMQSSLATMAPHVVWDEVRQQKPHAASFPLGGVCERATRRLVLTFNRGWNVGPERMVHQYLALLIFETALMDLRGSSDYLDQDFGFWYHWHTDGQLRSIADETEMRTRLWFASVRAAVDLMRVWKPSQRNRCANDENVDAALREVFQRGPAPRRKQGATVTVLGVKADGPIARQHAIDRGAPQIIVGGPSATAILHDEQLLEACGGTLDSRVRDLLDIATTFYFADICIPRNGLFARDLVFLMPVRNPVLWSENADMFARMGAFLTGNDVVFRFTARSGKHASPRRISLTDDERCVALFSGGLDSFVGAAQMLRERCAPILVSHSASASLIGMQRELLATLQAGGNFDSVHVRTSTRKGLPIMESLRTAQTELYQHGRSLLFLSLATAVALSKGIANVRVYENGPVALNVAFSEARFNTRTTHPVFFVMFRKLIKAIFDVDIRLENPFELLTKGEVVELLSEERHSAIRLTNSCWGYSKVQLLAKRAHADGFGGKHCGRCIPCVWRRAAVRHANLGKFDDHYLWDAVPDERWGDFLDRRHLTVLLDLYRVCQTGVAARTDHELLDLNPDLDEIGPGTPAERLAMHRRYAQEIVDDFDHIAPRLYYRPADDRRVKRG
jgi:7-cyano-7-deazaguanine synthase in queuosine biosynthesis